MDRIGKWLDEDEYLFTKSMHAYIESRIIWDLKRLPISVFRMKKNRYENREFRYSVSASVVLLAISFIPANFQIIKMSVFCFYFQAPENELRKVNVNSGERILSEHELRIQRSLQRLNLPEWYKTCNVPAQGFILKRHSDAGYTTSMSSLSSNQSQSPKMYSNNSKQ